MWERLFDTTLRKLIGHGRLDVMDFQGNRHSYGSGSDPVVTVRLHDAALPRDLMRNPDLVLGEAYMDERLTIDDDDLPGFLSLMLQNRGRGRTGPTIEASLAVRRMLRRVRQRNPLHRAKKNVAHHYDLSGDLYDLFLDSDRQYSCAYFRHPDDTLEQAQEQKKGHIAAKLCLEPGMRVFDIGCGWGGLALTLARDYGVHVLGVTLSREQHAYGCRRVQEAGLEHQIELRLADYRTITGSFDRIVSVGMFEHVGVPHYPEYFAQVRDRLTGDGVALIHTIGRNEPPGSASPWMDRYIFPGGYVPAMSEVLSAIERQRLHVTDVEVWRLHYAETLLHWRKRFEANIDQARALYDDRFCRMWRYYLTASEMSFRHFNHCVFQFQIARQQEAVPLTRDYLCPGTPAQQ